MVIATLGEMLAHARQQVTAYLAQYPGEGLLLERLTRQLFYGVEDVFARSNMWGHITASALVYDPVADKVLVIYHKLLGRWLQPGGHHEGLQALWLSALREAIEETGIVDCTLHAWHSGVDGPFDIDTHAIAAQPKKNEGVHVHHDFLYLFKGDSRRPLAPQLSEVLEAKWIDRIEFASLLGDRFGRLAKKLEACIQADALNSNP